MNKKSIIIISTIVLLFTVLMITFYFVWNAPTFNGNRIRNPHSYEIDFKEMNGTDRHVISLKEGDVLDVHVEKEKGFLSFGIGIEHGYQIYKSDDATNMDFKLNISKDGDYVINVYTKHAKGKLFITLEK